MGAAGMGAAKRARAKAEAPVPAAAVEAVMAKVGLVVMTAVGTEDRAVATTAWARVVVQEAARAMAVTVVATVGEV